LRLLGTQQPITLLPERDLQNFVDSFSLKCSIVPLRFFSCKVITSVSGNKLIIRTVLSLNAQ
ncbi:hypothetical protein, partial [Mesotoga sp. UBA5847]|uniref:hypothetical protein n=1 Tax=Mesotoga sp. UBA5847 TaxID=1946859 RepID=UPI0025F8A012